MLKVVLVEDETVIREGIRDIMPWEEYGYQFVGEAGDGEMALSVIRETHPDLLITDVKMPFMDGLSLCKIVSEEFPKMKIIIISGYDDFEYARQAISLGVDRYLLKPITKLNLKKALLELREKFEAEEEQHDYQAQYANEMHEFEQFSRRRFFEQVIKGDMSVMEIYDEASKLGLEISAASYNLVFCNLSEKANLSEENQELFARKQEELYHYILRQPQYILFGWDVNNYGVLVKSSAEDIANETTRLIDRICQVCQSMDQLANYYVGVGKPVERMSGLSECYQEVSHNMAYRFLASDQHVLSAERLAYLTRSDEQSLDSVDSAKMNPEIIREFLQQGNQNEIADFVASYVLGIRDALHSNMFRDYVVLNIRFTILAFVESLGVSTEEHTAKLNQTYSDMHLRPEEVEDYFVDMLQAALVIRDQESDVQSGRVLRRATEYVDNHFDKESISLNEVASAVNVSANYLSTIFSQNMEETFVEYLTGKRMEKAKKLLKSTDKPASEIGLEVGYKDPHYFSFVFKKTQGMSPREYRSGKK